MTPKIEIVTTEKAKKDTLKILIGIQIGFVGFVLRIGIYY